MDGIEYPTVEHAFQAHKTQARHGMQAIADEPTPRKAKAHGRRVNLRKDWQEVKIHIMIACLREKFKIPHLRKVLLKTGNRHIVEVADRWNDDEWGIGRDGDGQNKLGLALMIVRMEIQDEEKQ